MNSLRRRNTLKQRRQLLKAAFAVALAGYGIIATPSYAQVNKDFNGSNNNNYGNNGNWTPSGVPGAGDQAIFGRVAVPAGNQNVDINQTASIDRVLFNGGANAQSFNLSVLNNRTYTILGTENNTTFGVGGASYGVENSSGFTQTITLKNTNSRLNINGNSTFTNTGVGSAMVLDNTNGGRIEFSGSATAGDASTTINNANDGFTRFNTGTSAGNANINNTKSGQTYFEDGSNAGSATIVNKNGATDFNGLSTANTANITNNANGVTRFHGFTNATNADITNNGNNGNIGETRFLDNSDGGFSTITNKSDGVTTFKNSSDADNANITNRDGGQTGFEDGSKANYAQITNNGAGSITHFDNNSNAEHAGIINKNGGATTFNGNSNAGGAGITNESSGGTVYFTGLANGNGNPNGGVSIQNKDNGVLDISQASNAVTIGEVYGAGNIFLGGASGGNAGTLVTGNSDYDRTISGVIADGGLATDANGVANPNAADTGGSLQKEGTAILRLTNDNTYTGTTTVNDGTLQLDGSIVSDTVVNSGGRLTGNGNIGGPNNNALSPNDLTSNDGDIAPGHDANALGNNSNLYRRLDVGGSFTITDSDAALANGATFESRVDGLGDHNRLIAHAGDINLDGSVRVQAESESTGGVYLVTNRYRIVHTENGVRNGTFDGIDLANSNLDQFSFLDPSLDYDAASAFLVLRRTNLSDLSTAGDTRNERAIFGSLNDALADPNSQAFGSLADLFNTFLLSGNQKRALDNISGDALTAYPVATQEVALRFNDRLRNRILNLLNGSTQVALLPGHSPRLAYTGTRYKALLAANPDGTATMQRTAMADAAAMRRSNIWADLSYARDNADDDGNGPGFSAHATEYQVGYDRLVGVRTRLGIAVGHSDGSLNVDDRDADGDFDTNSIGLYAAHEAKSFYLNGQISYNRHSIHSNRDLLAGGDADADYHGRTIALQGEVGKRYGHGTYSVEPNLTFKINNTHTDGFREDGGAGTLRSDADNYNTRRVGIGVRFVNRSATARIRPHLALSYEHEFGDTQSELSNQLIGLNSNFTVRGTDLGSNIFRASLGADARLNDRFSLSGEIGASRRSNQHSEYIYGGVNYGF